MTLDEECVALYRQSRSAFLSGDVASARTLHAQIRRDYGCELFYEVDLPENLRLVHPLGCVLGRATYGDHLVAYQGASVGSDVDGGRPRFMGSCVLFPGAKVLGRAVVGPNVWITANTVVQNVTVPDNSVVYPALIDWRLGRSIAPCAWRPTKRSVIERFFK